MKKVLLSLLVIFTLCFSANVSLACDFGCGCAKSEENIECPKDCKCGCQDNNKCKCKRECQKSECGCKKNLDFSCKKECPKADKPKCSKENSLTDEIINSTKAEDKTQCDNKEKCNKLICDKSQCDKQCKKSKCCKNKCHKKCKKNKSECKKGCPLSEVLKDTPDNDNDD